MLQPLGLQHTLELGAIAPDRGFMPRGTVESIVHRSQSSSLANSQLVASHDDKGYGNLIDEDQHQIYFSHEVVAGALGFDLLRQGMQVHFTRDSSPFLCAASVEQLPRAVAEKT